MKENNWEIIGVSRLRQGCVKNAVKKLRRNFLQKYLTAESG